MLGGSDEEAGPPVTTLRMRLDSPSQAEQLTQKLVEDPHQKPKHHVAGLHSSESIPAAPEVNLTGTAASQAAVPISLFVPFSTTIEPLANATQAAVSAAGGSVATGSATVLAQASSSGSAAISAAPLAAGSESDTIQRSSDYCDKNGQLMSLKHRNQVASHPGVNHIPGVAIYPGHKKEARQHLDDQDDGSGSGHGTIANVAAWVKEQKRKKSAAASAGAGVDANRSEPAHSAFHADFGVDLQLPEVKLSLD